MRCILLSLIGGLGMLLTAPEILAQLPKVSLDDLNAPSSPAFTILGVQPNEINRPKSFKELETSLLSSFSNSNTFQIPTNYALEVTPYWLKTRPDLSVDQLMNPGTKAFMQTLSVSIATARRRNLIDTTRTVQQIGFGLRATIFPGRLTPAFANDKATLRAKMAGLGFVKFALIEGLRQCSTTCFADENALRAFLAGKFNSLPGTLSKAEKDNITKAKRDVIDRTLLEFDPRSPEECQLVLEEMNNRLNAYEETSGIREAASRVERHYFLRQGFRMDVALASSLDFPTNDFNYSLFSQWGGWINPGGSWVVGKNKDINIEFISVGRYLRNQLFANETRNIDVGGRLIGSWRSLSLSGEYIHRFQEVVTSRIPSDNGITRKETEDQRDHRLVFSVDWRLSDRFVFTYALGRNFSLNTAVNGNLISILGLNFGIGPLVNVPKPEIGN